MCVDFSLIFIYGDSGSRKHMYVLYFTGKIFPNWHLDSHDCSSVPWPGPSRLQQYVSLSLKIHWEGNISCSFGRSGSPSHSLSWQWPSPRRWCSLTHRPKQSFTHKTQVWVGVASCPWLCKENAFPCFYSNTFSCCWENKVKYCTMRERE